MKAVERKLNKAQLAIVWLLVITLVLAAAYVTLVVVARKLSEAASGVGSSSTAPTPLEGESVYLNQLVAYPTVDENNITFIEIENEHGRFGVSRYPNDLGAFLFHYYEGDDETTIPYMPPILGSEADYNYENLYAIEKNDSYGMIPYLTYLCSALSTPYFAERIELPANDTEENIAKRTALLREYGLTQDSPTVYFTYGKRDASNGHIIEGSEQAHYIILGEKALSGNGYYFMVDNRNYVYYTSGEYFKYALTGLHSFIKGMLVAEGFDGDSVYGPYLTTDFKEWVTTVYKNETDVIFTKEDPAYKNFTNPKIVVNGSYFASIDKGLQYVPENDVFSGYETDVATKLAFDLEKLAKSSDFERVKNAFLGRNVGSYVGREILITMLEELYNSEAKSLDFSESESVGYEYTISKIEAVLEDTGERASGVVDSSDSLLKVTYRYTVGGQTVQHDCHAVLDLTKIESTESAKLLGLSVGTELDPVTITVNYTKENSLKTTEKYVLTGVNSIFTVDENGTGALMADVITEQTYVNITYYRSIGGVKGETQSAIIRLCDIKDTDKRAPLKEILLGKGKGSYDEVVYNSEYYYQVMREFVTYEISEIEYFVADEIVVSFCFENASLRDPFYGETFYKNTLENSNRLYGLNSGSCETAVKLLGGIGTDSNSAVGLSGETVAIGLSLANMEKYGLFAHKIYFEMPRGITDASESAEDADDDALSDFIWLNELGFTLYISDPVYDEDGTRIRYIGSDMYDLIAKVNAADFDFVEYGFVEFWARKNILMMDITKLTNLKLEFNMSDLQGVYEFDVLFKDMYAGKIDGKFIISDTNFEGSSPVVHEIINVKASEDAFSTVFKDKFGTSWGDLSTVYDHTMGDGTPTYFPGSRDTLGAAYFNSVYATIQMTPYLDCLTAEEISAGYEKEVIFKIHFEVEDKEYRYTYEFRRIDDRRVMVTLYRSDADGNKVESIGEVSDFYVSTLAFKKIVNQYIYLLNGKEVDESISYN